MIYMKTLTIHIGRIVQGISFRGILIIRIFSVSLLVTLFSCTTPYMVRQNPEMVNITPPQWAPDYDNFNPVNYYYLPDIECYYDLRNREFVYMQDGNWRFSASLPSIYASFDLNNCFVVKLNISVQEPWRHFQYYVAHYPRYYYKSVNRDRGHDNSWSSRWFNENPRHSGNNNDRPNNEGAHRNVGREDKGYKSNYNKSYNNQVATPGGNRTENRQGAVSQPNPNNINSVNQVNNGGVNGNRQRSGSQPAQNDSNKKNQVTNSGNNHNEVKQSPQTSGDTPRKNGETTRQTEPVKYYGRQIGQPVKVQRNMRKSQDNKIEEKDSNIRTRRSE